MGKKNEEIPQIGGYTCEKKTISMLWANLLSIALLVIPIGIGFALMQTSHLGLSSPKSFLFLCALLIVGIVVHELIHGFTWLLLLHKSFSHLSFGFLKGGVYCHIDVPMRKKEYVIGALMPLVLVGIIPWILGIVTGSFVWMIAGAILISGAIGDIMIVWTIRKEPSDALVYDHPSEPGCYIYHKTSDQ